MDALSKQEELERLQVSILEDYDTASTYGILDQIAIRSYLLGLADMRKAVKLDVRSQFCRAGDPQGLRAGEMTLHNQCNGLHQTPCQDDNGNHVVRELPCTCICHSWRKDAIS